MKKESYLGKARDVIKYFNKPLEEVTMQELREYLLKYLKGLSERNFFENYKCYFENKYFAIDRNMKKVNI